MSDPYLLGVRQEYLSAGIDIPDIDPDPLVELGRWLDAAVAAGVEEPNAMVLATVDPAGVPSARAVLLKGIDGRGLVFYTSYESLKAADIEANPAVALVFVWIPLHRQVRVRGVAAKVPPEESDAYFAARPSGARIGSAASIQSRVIPDRMWLEMRAVELAARYPEGNVPRPATWGGYRVTPTEVELFQGRPNRLHDRIRYRRDGDAWVRERLAP